MKSTILLLLSRGSLLVDVFPMPARLMIERQGVAVVLGVGARAHAQAPPSPPHDEP